MTIKYNKEKLVPIMKRFDEGYYFYKDGRIWRTKRTLNATKVITLESPEVASHSTKRGYRRLTFKNTTAYEHTIIYALFHGIDSLDTFDCIDHKNSIKSDNRIENLEGVTTYENNLRAENQGLVPRLYGEKNGGCKLSNSDIKLIHELREKGLYQYEIAEKVGVSQGYVCRVLNGLVRRGSSEDSRCK